MRAFQKAREQAFLELKRAPSASARAAAAGRLYQLADAYPNRAAELVEVLPALLTDPQPEVRRAGVALSSITLPPEEAQEVLWRALRDTESSVRLEAAGRLADMGHAEARGALAVALQDPVFEVRFEAARGMATLGHRAGREILVDALDRVELRFRAIGALAELGDPQAIPPLQALMRRLFLPPFERTQTAGALAKLGDPSGGTHLLARTRRRWSPDRSLALELCGEVRAAGAFERLTEVLADPKDTCRGAAARGLGRLGDPRALGPLRALLEDAAVPEDVRLDAAEGLCRLGIPEARSVVAEAQVRWLTPETKEELAALLAETAA